MALVRLYGTTNGVEIDPLHGFVDGEQRCCHLEVVPSDAANSLQWTRGEVVEQGEVDIEVKGEVSEAWKVERRSLGSG